MIKSLLSEEQPLPEPEPDSDRPTPPRPARADGVLGLFDSAADADSESVSDHSQHTQRVIPYDPEPSAEGIRQSGLAYSAGIAFSAAVIFMLILGWGADVVLGTSPWGIVAGILLGSIIGFVQFFRLTSQIFKK